MSVSWPSKCVGDTAEHEIWPLTYTRLSAFIWRPELSHFCNQEGHEERCPQLRYDHVSFLWYWWIDWYRIPRWKRLNAIWYSTFWWSFGSKHNFLWWLQQGLRQPDLICDWNGPVLGYGGHDMHWWGVWWSLAVLFQWRHRSITMNGQEKENLQSSAELCFCFQPFVQSIHLSALTAIKDNHRPVYVYGEDRYLFFGHCGNICWKTLGKLQLKWFDVLIGVVQNWRDAQWYEVLSTEQHYQWVFPLTYGIKQLTFVGWRRWAVYLNYLADKWLDGIKTKQYHFA